MVTDNMEVQYLQEPDAINIVGMQNQVLLIYFPASWDRSCWSEKCTTKLEIIFSLV